ncbi:MAG TPA: DNA polymerase III subunit gamma/tau [Spongiibacteraceae bacterium]|jgi:DNA polymerase-3 subunit gamma/tau|nr:DNA polymerase III subunit gamma/tau [Spongiibacteraceae bacterium]HUH37038.1 DNA polymerase III subunit gamma/tau [Spongiibacteraceae bacterium]
MTYQVLARKWRPKSFRELVGQEHVLRALVNALDHDRLHHAYLFTGTRGVGKTTIARILARCLNCEVGVSSEPCGQCGACREISEGRFVDLIEVDAASRTKVEDTRELLDNVQYAPTAGRYKVYLIDEVHMLSTHSFNALLKTLEEPPPHVKFLLATTDPQKLPATVLSRCLQFNLKNMTPERIVDHLRHVLDAEMISYDEPALWQLGRAAQGSMRDALSLTDQAIAFGSGKLRDDDVRAMLGSVDTGSVHRLLQALAAQDAEALLATVTALAEQAVDYAGILEALLALLHRVALAQALPEAVDNSMGDADEVRGLAAQLTAEDAQLFYQLGLNARRDLPLAPDPRTGLEMALLRMLVFRPDGDGASQAAPAETSPAKKPEGPPVPRRAEAGAQSSTGSVSQAPEQERQPSRFDRRAPGRPDPAPESGSGPASGPELRQRAVTDSAPAVPGPTAPLSVPDRIALAPVMPEPEPTPVVAAAAPLPADLITPDSWPENFQRLGLSGVLGSIAANCQLLAVEGDVWQLRLERQQASLFNDSHTARLQEVIGERLGEALHLQIEVGDVDGDTPARWQQRRRRERLEQARQLLDNDPLVKGLREHFDAVLLEDTIEPL